MHTYIHKIYSQNGITMYFVWLINNVLLLDRNDQAGGPVLSLAFYIIYIYIYVLLVAVYRMEGNFGSGKIW